jgi:hypothetical protein
MDKRYKEVVFPDHPSSIQTNFTFNEESQSWYCTRVWANGPGNQRAISSAFYFGGSDAAPPPAEASVHTKLLDADSGRLLTGSVTEVQFYGTQGQDGKRHLLAMGEGQLSVPGTARLRGEATGYVPVVLSPVLDNPELVSRVTSLSDTNLLEWKTFEDLRERLSKVELEFRLKRQ